MNQFLYSVAQAFYSREGESIKDNTFIFPSRRAELFFIKYLSQISSKPIFSPNTITIDDFISEVSGYALADRVEMLFLLYDNYIKISKSSESFDDFYYWADILLTDFDDIDKYLVDASKIFSNLYELKEVDAQFKDMLTDEQKEFLKRFIANFDYNENIKGSKKEFITLWKIMYKLYIELKQNLDDRGCAYNGMMLRSIIERIADNKITKQDIELRYKKLVFVGFNLLSTAEDKMMTMFKDMGIADFYWDYNLPIHNDSYSISSISMKQNIERFPSAYNINDPLVTSFPDIELVAIPSNIGQTRYAGEVLKNLFSQNSTIDLTNTVVVLPDEKLLMPMLYSIPSIVKSVNVTMGYPLCETPLYSLFKAVFEMLIKAKQNELGGLKYYHHDVLSLMQQPYVRKLHYELVAEFSNKIKSNNLVYITQKEIPEDLKYLFVPLTNNREIFQYIINIIEKILKEVAENDLITKEFLFYYKTIINRLQEIVKEFPIKEQTLFKLIDKMSAGLKVPFKGEPLSGLQVMGVLETRALDFENVIILSMNEGVFPADSRGDTFIPYNLRKGFGMSSYEQRDGIAEYYFYRLISRAKRVFLTYDTRVEGVKVGDVSRFVYQLKYQYFENIKSFTEKNINYTIKLPEDQEIKVEKRGEVLDKLNEFYKGGKNSLSASSINEYIDCPLKFYFSQVEKIKDSNKVLEDVDASIFGTIYHEIMQKIYAPYEGKIITSEIIDKIREDKKSIEDIMLMAFAKNYYNTKTSQPLTGRLYLRGEIIKRMVQRTLEIDKGRTPFKMLKTELGVRTTLKLPNNKEVQVKGFIDRLDLDKEFLNIIDYKSGQAVIVFEKIESIFNQGKDRRKQVFQLLFYVFLLKKAIKDIVDGNETDENVKTMMKNAGINDSNHDKIFIPGLYSFERYFNDKFEWQIMQKIDKVKYPITIEKESELYDEYKNKLEEVISSILDEEIPFTQAKDLEICKYCPYINICKR